MTATDDRPRVDTDAHRAYLDERRAELAAVGAGPVPRLFGLRRHLDVTAVSGEGLVAVGLVWPHNGGAVYRWCSDAPPLGYDQLVRQVCVFDDLPGVLAVHGHAGSTELRTVPASEHVDQADAFAITDGYGDVLAWGVTFPEPGVEPGDQRTVTYRPPLTPIRRALLGERVEVWRRRRDALAEHAALGGVTVWLASQRGRRLLATIEQLAGA